MEDDRLWCMALDGSSRHLLHLVYTVYGSSLGLQPSIGQGEVVELEA
jgi:hypothetical protein